MTFLRIANRFCNFPPYKGGLRGIFFHIKLNVKISPNPS